MVFAKSLHLAAPSCPCAPCNSIVLVNLATMTGEWEHDRVLGTKGRFTLLTGLAHEDKVHLKVFGY